MSNEALGSFGKHIKEKLSYKYEIDSLLGRGGMANVYKAIQKGLDREVAVKVIHPSLVNDQESIKRFRLEAKSSARLNHSNVITIYDVDEVEDILFLTLEYLEGEDLSKKIKKTGNLNAEQLSHLMQPLGDALNYIHKKGLVHRDIKSSNIFITESNKPVLMDFGIASLRENSSGTITNIGTVIGTPEFMSPEQASGYTVGPGSDIYSLGVVMYQCLCGQLPFSGETAISTIVKISTTEPPQLDINDVSVPSWLTEIVFKCLAKSPEDRFHNALELKEALHNKKIKVSEVQSSPKQANNSRNEEEKSRIAEIRNLIDTYHHAPSLDLKISILEKLDPETRKSINADKELNSLNRQKERLDTHMAPYHEVERALSKLKSYPELKELIKSVAGKQIYFLAQQKGQADLNAIYQLLLTMNGLVNQIDFLAEQKTVSSNFISNYTLLVGCRYALADISQSDWKKPLAILTKEVEKVEEAYVSATQSLFESLQYNTDNLDMIASARVLLELIERNEMSGDTNQALKELLAPYHHKSFLVAPSQATEDKVAQAIAPDKTQPISVEKASSVSQYDENRPAIDSDHIVFNFDSEFQYFINENISSSQQVRDLLSVDKMKLQKLGNSRLLYLFFSPRLNNNGFDLIFRNHYPLRSKLQMQMQMGKAKDLKIVSEDKVVNLVGVDTDKDLSTAYGKDLWDAELKMVLKKLKSEEPIECSEQQKRNILQMNFNNLMLRLKPYIFSTITSAMSANSKA